MRCVSYGVSRNGDPWSHHFARRGLMLQHVPDIAARSLFCARRPITAAIATITAAFTFALNATPLAAQPFRSGFNATTLGNTDDGFAAVSNIGFTYRFYGFMGTSLFVNNNGNVTFDQELEQYTPYGLAGTNRPMLAPFFADVDTRATNAATYGTGTIGTRNAFGVNWLGVGYFDQHVDKLNYFQLVMIDRNDVAIGDFDFEFNYGFMQWETGDAGGGLLGLGGDDCARAGWASGGTAAAELVGSGVCGALISFGANSLDNGGNGQTPGRFGYQVRDGVVLPTPVIPTPPTPVDPPPVNPPGNPGSTVAPEPSTYAMLAMGLAGVLVMSRRRRLS